MDINTNLNSEYDERAFIYGRISTYMKVELTSLLWSKQIPFLTIDSRIKTLDSFIEKVDRKGYLNPFYQMEDFCGFRIICYYQSDMIKISCLINEEFEVLESFNKEDSMKENEFGYRSYHIIAKIPKGRSPLIIEDSFSEYKFEIQIRTVLMHAWAEIQHKLAYKNEDQIAPSMRKEFAFLSAKLEESDYQFERLKNESEQIQKDFKDKVEKQGISKEEKFNLDSFRVLLESMFPNRKEDLNGISKLLEQIREAKLDVSEAIKLYKKAEDYILNNLEVDSTFFTRSGVIRTALNLLNDEFWNNYLKTVDMIKYAKWVQEKEQQRKILKQNTSD
jgi:ppGpp synthetase/RelA/SpoT-type nucleotidyltranferase